MKISKDKPAPNRSPLEASLSHPFPASSLACSSSVSSVPSKQLPLGHLVGLGIYPGSGVWIRQGSFSLWDLAQGILGSGYPEVV